MSLFKYGSRFPSHLNKLGGYVWAQGETREGCGIDFPSFLIVSQKKKREGARGCRSQEAESWSHVRMSHQKIIHALAFLVVGDICYFIRKINHLKFN